jgi:hypothetical protein
MSYLTSGIEQATSGAKDVLSLQEAQQRDVVRPRELEAATSLAESRATVARSQVDVMQRLSRADQEAANAVREANAVGDQGKTLELRSKAYAEAGMLEQANEMQEKIKKNQIEGYDSVIKANKAQEAANEGLSVTLRSLTDYAPALEFGEATLKKAQEEVASNPSPENRAKMANTASIVSQLRLAQQQGKPWQDTYKTTIEPLAESLSTSALNAKKVAEEGRNQRAAAKNAADIQRAELAAIVRSQEAAARRDREVVGKQTRVNTETMKLDQAYSRMEQKLQSELDKIKETQGTEVDNPDASIWVAGDSKIANPQIASKEAQIKALRERHDENMAGLQVAIESGKTFVPKPYTNLEAPKTTSFTPEQESWIDRAAKANPGVSREDIIAQGKKMKKL